MIFMAVSAVCGGICSASAKLPMQLHGRCHPINHKAERYTTKFVAKNATSKLLNLDLLFTKQITAIRISKIPTSSSRYRKGIPNIGSSKYSIRSLPKKLTTFAPPVEASTMPNENTNHLTKGLFISIVMHKGLSSAT